MASQTAEVIVVGAGIAGIATAHHLARRLGIRDVAVVDHRPPLTLTSDKSTEAYRNWWPGPDGAMIQFMNRSIELLEELAAECGNRFRMNRRGYVYATASPREAETLRQLCKVAEGSGAGPVRIHQGRADDPEYVPHEPEGLTAAVSGADLFLDNQKILHHFPYLAEDTQALLHARHCGWFDGQQLGMYLLERARQNGIRLVPGRVTGFQRHGDQIEGVRLALDAGAQLTLNSQQVVIACGPYLPHVCRQLGLDLPVYSELHRKAAFHDPLRAIPRSAPLLIWCDPQHIPWSEEDRRLITQNEAMRWLLQEFPASVHARPEGGADADQFLALWPYDCDERTVELPLPEDPYFAELALRGMARMIPGLRRYLQAIPRAFVDGGYYTKTPENRFLSGPLPLRGAYVIGALSGYGLMAACGAAEIVCAHVTGTSMPSYAQSFALSRYENPAYLAQLENWGSTGQL